MAWMAEAQARVTVSAGVVARKHWEPTHGMAGYGHGQMHAVETLAVVIALAAVGSAAMNDYSGGF